MRAGVEAFKNAFEGKKAFMSGFEAFKKNRKLPARKRLKKQPKKYFSWRPWLR